MLRKYVEIRETVLALVRNEDGSEVAQAAGVAILATALIGGMLAVQGDLRSAVEGRFQDLLAQIGG